MQRKIVIPHLPTKWDAATESRIPSVDLNPAAIHGRMLILFDDLVSFERVQQAVDVVLAKVETEMDDEDYILCVGDPVLGGAALAAASRKFGFVRALRWDKSKAEYDVMEFSYE